MKYYILFFIVVNNLNSYSQDVNLKGNVKDKNGNSIPYSIITNNIKSNGICGDSIGFFSFKTSFNDTLIVSNLGYETKKIAVQYLLQKNDPILIILDELTIKLNEVKVYPSSKFIKIGVLDRKSDTKISTTVKNNFEICLPIPNINKINGRVKKISYFISKSGKPNTPFRVRIYELDETNAPSKSLLHKSIIIKPDKGNKWIEIDLSDYEINFEKHGIAISMEWLYTGNKKYSFEEDNSLSFGQRIGAIFTKDFNYFVRSNQGGWAKVKLPENYSFAPMINCEISY